jgi:hypothetical protein
VLAFAFVVVPLLASEYLFRAILIPFLILSLAALGLNILVGYCGQISLGTGAFMAVGAYAAYNFQVRIEGMPLCWHAAGRPVRHRGGRAVRHPVAAHQGPVPGGGHAGGAVLLSTGPSCASSGSPTTRLGLGQRGRPQRLRLPDRHAGGQVPVLPGFLVVFACWPRTWCAATSAASGWPSATWTWPPP